jgi:hypothetical protein
MENALPLEVLRRICDPNDFDFETSATLPDLQEVLSQPRARQSHVWTAGTVDEGLGLSTGGALVDTDVKRSLREVS